MQNRTDKDIYDYLVIGTGPAGFVSSITAAQVGMKVAVVQEGVDMLGGACLHEGVIPAKSLIRSADIYKNIVRDAGLFGLEEQNIVPDMVKMVDKANSTIDQLRKGLTGLFKKNGIDTISGQAQFIDRNNVSIIDNDGNTKNIQADKFLVATGSIPKPLSDIPFDHINVISSTDALRLKEIPRKIVIVGGGAIGTEFASFFNIIGSEVILVEFEDSLLPGEDSDITTSLEQVFKKDGIGVYTSSKVTKVLPAGSGSQVTIQGKESEITEECDMVLVSIGRIPSSKSVGLENAGVKVDERGFIPVNKEMNTNIENIYAAGDVIPTPMLANIAFIEGEIAAKSAAGLAVNPIDYGLVPNVVYTDIQVASIGLTEEQLIGKNIEYTVGKQMLMGTFKASINAERTGFIKVVADTKKGTILGAHIFAPEASELIQGFVIAMKAGLTTLDLSGLIPPNPTFSESLIDAAKSVFNKTVRS